VLKCLKYAHETGFPWNELICQEAATAENWECLRYAHENGCPYWQHLREDIVKHVLLPKWREAVKKRGILFYWMEKAMESACSEGGEGRKRDREEFEKEFVS
jgi:hypothetical protein